MLSPYNAFLCAAAAAFVAAVGIPTAAQEQSKAAAGLAFTTGDIAVTSFAGPKLQTESLKPSIDPVSKTVIDAEGVTLRIYDGSALGGPMAGQKIVPSLVEFKARDIGHTFGLAFDPRPATETTSPALYAAATSAFGLHITGADKDGDGTPDRLTKGAPDAEFMEGLFGGLQGGGPGSIWKIDPATSKVEIFADVGSGGVKNSGPGLGGLAVDIASGALYASDLDTGLIHRFDLNSSAGQLGAFDHGVSARPAAGKPAIKDDGKRLDITSPDFDTTAPATWATTQTERRVDALAAREGRLYYSVAEGPEVWSVGLEADGAFKSDPRLELRLKSETSFPITALAFDASDRLLLAERGAAQNPANFSGFAAAGPSRALRFVAESPDDPATPGLWQAEPQEYAIGNAKQHRDSSGGLALQNGYAEDGTLDAATCDGTLVVSSSALGPTRAAHGLQVSPIDLLRDGDEPPTEHVFINLNSIFDDEAARGYAGGVAVWRDCSGGAFPPVASDGAGFPPVASDGAGFPPVAGGGGGFPPVTGGEPFPPVTDNVTDTGAEGGSGGKRAPLTVAKTASVTTCSPKGGCAFNIEVSNPNAQDVPGPIVIDEAIEAPLATLTGEPNAPWSCTKAAPFQCTHPGPMAGNGKLDMRVVFAPNTPPETKQLRNCAVLSGTPPPAPGTAPAAEPAGKVRAPQNQDDGKGLKTAIVATPVKCRATETCGWDVILTNASAAPITGPLTFDFNLTFSDDELGGLAKSASTEILTSNVPPGTVCQVIDAQINCKNPSLQLAPNASLPLAFKLKVSPPAGKPNIAVSTVQANASTTVGVTSAKIGEPLPDPPSASSVTFSQFDAGTAGGIPAAPGGAQPAPVADAAAGADPRCATIALDPNAKVQDGGFLIAKKGAGKCTAKGPCAFTISVTNQTGREVSGFTLREEIDAPQAVLAGEPNAPWTCNKAAPFECTHPGPLPANSTTELNLSFTPNTPPGKTELKNCAIQVSGHGGKAVPGQQNQIAPGKKTDLDFRRGSGHGLRDSMIQPASLRASMVATSRHQSFDLNFLHRVGAGNIGGVTNNCLKWGPPPAFSVQQADGTAITFDNVSIDPAGNLRGNAKIFNGRRGTIDGRFDGSLVSFRLRWSDGTIGDYTARVDANGMIAGLTRDIAGGPNVKFNGLQPWKCARNEICDKYSKNATEAATKFNQLSCGPDQPPGRWSNDPDSHLNWCMGQPLTSPFPNSETVARMQALEACGTERAALCDGFVADALVTAKDFEARQCIEQHSGFLSTDPEAQRKLCLEQSRGNLDSIAQSRKVLLDTCIARLAKAEGGAGGGQPGGGGGAGDAGAAAEPAPEQCAVVPIEPDAPGPGPVAEVLQDGKPVIDNTGVEITKTVGKDAPCAEDNCPFVVTIRNTTAAAMPGPLTVIDAGNDFGNGTFGFLELASGPEAPWTCAALPSPPNAPGFRCVHPGPLAAGASASMRLGMKRGLQRVPAGNVTASKMDNCAFMDGDSRSCASAPIDNPAPPTPSTLVFTKSPTVEQCSDAGGGCAFTVSITNPGPAEFNDSINFTDAPRAGDGKPFPNLTLERAVVTVPEGGVAPITCGVAGDDFFCSTGNAVRGKIPVGKTVQVAMSFKPGAGAGATAIRNCATLVGTQDKKCASIPLKPDANPPPPPPAAANNLVMTKNPEVERCSDSGGGCVFTISIKNPGPNAFTGPITVSDNLTDINGKTFPNVDFGNIVPSSSPDSNVPFICTKGGGGFVCTTADRPANLPANGTITITTDIKPGAGTGATSIRNCAQLIVQGVNTEQVCRTMPLINGPLLRATKITSARDTCFPECFYSVSIRNVGNADAIGPFAFTDRFTPAPKVIPIFADGGDFTCRLATEQGNGIAVCNGNKQRLAPGEQMIGKIAVKVIPLAPEYTNCAEIVPSGAPIDSTFPGRCVTVKEAQPGRANLSISKFVANPKNGNDKSGECKIEGPCVFRIGISNKGNAPYQGPITITDEIPQKLSNGKIQSAPGGIEKLGSVDWTCTKPSDRSISCTHKQTTLAPGNGELLEIVVTPGPGWKKNDAITNCASVATPVGNDGGSKKDDDTDCANYSLDPFSVKVAKSGDAECPPGGNCTFKISLFNPGPIDHNAPVTITDAMRPRVSAQIVSINPPLPCATQPTEIPFTCTSPGSVRLDLDAKAGDKVDGVDVGPRDYTMVVKMPIDGSVAAYRNCISVGGDAASAGEEACHTVTTKPKALSVSKTATSASCDESTPCNFKVTVTNTGAEPVAGPIAIADVTRVGRTPLSQVKLVSASAPWTCIASAAPGMQCSHPGPVPPNGSLDLTFSLQPLPGSLAGATEVRNCAGLAGTSTAEPGACATIPVKTPGAPPGPIACSGGMVLTSGVCACPGLTNWNGRECLGSGGINTSKPGDENPANPPPVETPGQPAPAACSAGLVLTGGRCACPPGARWNGRECVGTGGGINTSKPGDDTPQPQTKPPVRTCPDGFVGAPPNCCPRGAEFRDGACRGPRTTPPPSVRKCPDGFIGAPPNCCPRGTEFRRGQCRSIEAPPLVEKTKPKVCPANRPVGKFPNCCPVNSQFRNGACQCQPGFEIGRRGVCVPRRAVDPVPQPKTEPTVKCPPDTIFINGQCRRLTIPTQPKPQPKPSRDCGPGYRELSKPNKYGAYCEQIPVPGPAPQPQPAPPPPPPQQRCDKGFSGFKPNCTCSGNKEVIGGQCIPKIQ